MAISHPILMVEIVQHLVLSLTHSTFPLHPILVVEMVQHLVPSLTHSIFPLHSAAHHKMQSPTPPQEIAMQRKMKQLIPVQVVVINQIVAQMWLAMIHSVYK
ncbi:hypothetical protein VCUG_01169 [Vavraia culicis subsp. floridensis]|uniref:Uncharacterized protein n=1 Tax=Vavraia culicis (isolate floridensis) TaxID=948595 RepID=L2GW03_VAVCU|nr:uncharacterized protein VCUG_01169 [Vavraia culicis subsp. floridensis]ELA47285.1 hypothetical protein VCUG_01169 [Vavraia culicis subsp. floridensis]